MKLNEQSPLKISADKDKDGNYIPSSIHMTFEDSQINEAICSYLNCKQQMDLIAYEDNDKAVIEQQKDFVALLNAPKQIGLSVSSSFMLIPTKSVTAVIGLSKEPVKGVARGCQTCNMREKCQYRIKGGHCNG